MSTPVGASWIDRLALRIESRISRRGFLVRTAVVGSALTVGGVEFATRPANAYQTVCGPEASCASGWTAFCCSIHKGVNQCPPGSFAGGWWKAGGANMCGGSARYIVDCQAECDCGCSGGAFCGKGCWNCEPGCAHDRCDQRRVCKNVFRYGQCNTDRPCSGPVLCRAASCTPPWEWANCSTASAVDTATRAHNATCLPSWGPIMRSYRAMGSQASVLGASVGATRTIRGGRTTKGRKRRAGRIQRFTGGRMYWSRKTGAHAVPAPLLAAYQDLHETRGRLGFPVTDPDEPLDGASLVRFQRGVLARLPGADTSVLIGPIFRAWRETGEADGPLGMPVTGNTATTGGAFALFTHGSVFRQTGAAPIVLVGAVGEKYGAFGFDRGTLGLPTIGMRELVASTGARVTQADFQHGVIVAVSDRVAYGFWGSIAERWLVDGGVAGALGQPTSDLTVTGTSATATFARGRIRMDTVTGAVTVIPA